MADSRFSLALVNSLVNFDNYGDPIEQIIDDGNYWELTAGFRKKSDLFIRYNVGNFEDNYFQVGFGEKKQNFYQVIDTKDRFEAESSSGDVLSIYFRVDKATSEYGRKIFSLGELMGLAGGFYGSLLTIGSIFLSIFADKLFTGAVLSRIYKVDTGNDRKNCQTFPNTNPTEGHELNGENNLISSMANIRARPIQKRDVGSSKNSIHSHHVKNEVNKKTFLEK